MQNIVKVYLGSSESFIKEKSDLASQYENVKTKYKDVGRPKEHIRKYRKMNENLHAEDSNSN